MLVWLSIFSWAIHAVGSQSYSSRPRPYHFEYEVADDTSGDYHGHRETQNHDGSVTGSYFLLSSDGLWRETQYSDQGYGFKAVTNTFPPNNPPKHRKGSTFSVFQTSGSDFETISNDLIGRPVAGGNFNTNFKNANTPPVPVRGQDIDIPVGGNQFFSVQNGGLPPPILGQNVGVGFTGTQQNFDLPGTPNFQLESDSTPSLLGQDVNLGVGLPNPLSPLLDSPGSQQLPLQTRPNFFSNQGFGVKLPPPSIPSIDTPKNQFLPGSIGSQTKDPTKFNEIEHLNADAGIFDGDVGLFETQSTIPDSPRFPTDTGALNPQANLPGAFGDISNPGFQPQSFGIGRPLNNQPVPGPGDPQVGVNLKNEFPSGQFNSGNLENVGRPLSDTSSQVPPGNGNLQNTFFTGSRPDHHQSPQFGSQGTFNENVQFDQPNLSSFSQTNLPNVNPVHQNFNPGIGLEITKNQSPVNENVNSALFFSSSPSGTRQQTPPLNGNSFGTDVDLGGNIGSFGVPSVPESNPGSNGNFGFASEPDGNLGSNVGGKFRPDSGQQSEFGPGTGLRGNSGPDSPPDGGFGLSTGSGSNFGLGTGPGANFEPGSGVRGDFDSSSSQEENFSTGFPPRNNFEPGPGSNLNRPNFDRGTNFRPGSNAGDNFGSDFPQSGNINFGPDPSGNFGGPVPGANINPGSGPGANFGPDFSQEGDFTRGSGLDDDLEPFPGQITGLRDSFRPGFGAGNNFGNDFDENSDLGNNLGADFGFSHSSGVGFNANSVQSVPGRFNVQSGIPQTGGIALDDPRVGPQLPLRSKSPQKFRVGPSRKRSSSNRKVTRGIGFKLNSDVLHDLDDNPRNLPQGSVDILKNLQKSQHGIRSAATLGKPKRTGRSKVSKVKVREAKVISDITDNFTKGFSNLS